MPGPFQSVAYLQIRRRWLGIQIMTWAGRTGGWAGAPDALLIRDRRGRPMAFAPDDPRVVNAVQARPFSAFTHPRVFFDGISETAAVLTVYLRKAGWRRSSGPWTFVIHSRDEAFGTLTDVENRALTSLCRGLGAARVLIVEAGRELTPPEVLQVARGAPRASSASLIALDHL